MDDEYAFKIAYRDFLVVASARVLFIEVMMIICVITLLM